eukprot:853227-Alexandrium_andersonii.AAC.1
MRVSRSSAEWRPGVWSQGSQPSSPVQWRSALCRRRLKEHCVRAVRRVGSLFFGRADRGAAVFGHATQLCLCRVLGRTLTDYCLARRFLV